jgi:FKBP-type peptidyl-prolyl cis-trans isomerase
MGLPKKERMIALFFALLFAMTLVPAAIFAIINSVQNNKQDNAATSQQAKGENMLQGTKLAGFTPVSSVPELQKIDTVAGEGQEVKLGDTITVDYTGAVAATGIIFQSSKDMGQQATFKLEEGGLIKGWTDGLPGMKVGGTRRLVIPADLAYGASGQPQAGIPPNAPLVFDVTLYAVNK